MKEVTERGKKVLRILFTDFLKRYNAYNIREKIGVSNAGSLKLLKNLKKKNLVISEKIGNAVFYKVNINSRYLLKLMELIFLDHDELSNFVRGWLYDLKAFIPMVQGIFLFGSVIKKGKDAKDIDVCFIVKDYEEYSKIQAKIDEANKKNRLPVHPLYLTKKDFERKLKEEDKVLIQMIKNCVIVHGEELFVEVLKNVQS